MLPDGPNIGIRNRDLCDRRLCIDHALTPSRVDIETVEETGERDTVGVFTRFRGFRDFDQGSWA